MDRGLYNLTISLDLQRAFDTVNQVLLLGKLKICGSRDGTLKRECPRRPRENTKMWHILETLIFFIFRSEIPQDEATNVVYFLGGSDLLLFTKTNAKNVHETNRWNLVDISASSINTRTSLLKSAKTSCCFFVFFFRVCVYLYGRYWQII